MILVPEVDYKLKCYSPKRLNVVINWLSLHSALKEDRDLFIRSYDQLVEAACNPFSSQLFLTQSVHPLLRKRIQA